MIGRRQTGIAGSVARLESRIEELEQELRHRPPALPAPTPGWDPGDQASADGARSVSHAWLSILEPPVRRRPRLPRLPFEVLFLGACAAAAGVADLEPLRIAAVMGGAWLLVALTEWTATVADRRRAAETAVAPPQRVASGGVRSDQAWYLAPVERTFVGGALADSSTAIGRPGSRKAGGLADSETMIGTGARADLESTVERRAVDPG